MYSSLAFGLVERQGAVAHDRHVAPQDVEQLRQLVDAVFAQETAQAGDAGIVLDLHEGVFLLGVHDLLVFLFRNREIVGEKHAAFHVGEQLLHLFLVERNLRRFGVFFVRGILVQVAQFLETLIGVGAHRAELQEVENTVVAAHALRPVDDRSRAVELDGDGYDEQQRRKHDDRPERSGDVEGPFPERHPENPHLVVLVYDGLVREGVIGHEPQRVLEIFVGNVARHGAVDSGAQVTAAFLVAELGRSDQNNTRFGKPRPQETDVAVIGSGVVLFVEDVGVFGVQGRECGHRRSDVADNAHLPAGESGESGRMVAPAFYVNNGVFQSRIFLMRIFSSIGLKGLTM